MPETPRISEVIKDVQDTPVAEPHHRAVDEALAGAIRAGVAHPELLATNVVARRQQATETEQLRQELTEARQDSLTGLELRRAYFARLAEMVDQGIDRAGATTEQLADEAMGGARLAHLLVQLRQDPELAQHWATRIDVAYLSYWNDPQFRGHDGGDQALRTIAEVVKETMTDHQEDRAFRVGGDEAAVLVRRDPLAVGELQTRLIETVAAQPAPAGARIPLRVDVGTAGLWEGALALEQINTLTRGRLWEQLARGAGPQGVREALSKQLVEIVDQVADTRASIHKARTSLGQLLNYLRTDPEQFVALYPYMQKGALRITQRELEAWADADPAGDRERIDQFIQSRLPLEQQAGLQERQSFEQLTAQMVWSMVLATAWKSQEQPLDTPPAERVEVGR